MRLYTHRIKTLGEGEILAILCPIRQSQLDSSGQVVSNRSIPEKETRR